MVVDLLLVAIVNLLFGILIFAIPDMLRILVGGYFVLSGLIMLALYFL